MQKLLKLFIFESLNQQAGSEDIERDDDKLLTEPDYSPDEDDDPSMSKNEISACGGGAIAGVTTPLGTGPAHPNKGKKKKPAWEAAGSAFGGARLASRK